MLSSVEERVKTGNFGFLRLKKTQITCDLRFLRLKKGGKTGNLGFLRLKKA
jgi:hypothetical protein